MSIYDDWNRMAKENRAKYPPGTRILLLGMDDPHHPVPPGTRGTVDHVDDGGNIHMKWDTVDAFDEEKAKRLMDEKARLQQQLGNIRDGQLKREQIQSRLDDIYTILDGLKNRPMEYDEQIVRQLLECITVDSKEQITVIFVGGLKVVQPLID